MPNLTQRRAAFKDEFIRKRLVEVILNELTLPDSVASIGDGAFICCSDLSKITSLAEIPPVCGSGVFDRVNKTNCELIVSEGSVAAYTRAEVWNEFSNIRGFSGVEVTVADKTRKIVVE